MARGKGAPVVWRIFGEKTGHDEVVVVLYMDHARIQYMAWFHSVSRVPEFRLHSAKRL